jgi:hypothetical protein
MAASLSCWSYNQPFEGAGCAPVPSRVHGLYHSHHHDDKYCCCCCGLAVEARAAVEAANVAVEVWEAMETRTVVEVAKVLFRLVDRILKVVLFTFCQNECP